MDSAPTLTHIRKHRTSVRTKIIMIILLSLLPAFIMSIFTGIRLFNTSIKIAEREIDRLCSNASAQQRLIVQGTQQMLTTLLSSRSINHTDVEGMDFIFTRLVQDSKNYATILAVDTAGRVIAAGIETESYSLADRSYLREALNSGELVIAPYTISRSTGIPCIPFAQPVKTPEGIISSVLIAALSISSIETVMENVRLPDGAVMEIWDRDQNRLFRYPKGEAYPIGLKGDPKLVELTEALDANTVVSSSYNNMKMLFSSRINSRPHNSKYSFRVIVGIPSIISNNSLEQIGFFLFAALASLLCSLLLAVWLYRSAIGRRLGSINSELAYMSRMDPSSHSSPLADEDEIDLLYHTLRKTATNLARREKERDEALQQIQSSLTEKEVLLKEIHHRVKNNFQVISSLLSLQSMAIDDPDVLRMFDESRNRIQSMALIHERLYRSSSFSEMDFGEYVRTMAEQISTTYADQAGFIKIQVYAGKTPVPLESAVPLGLILNELISNCFKHAFTSGQEGNIIVRMCPKDDHIASISVTDDGSGFPESILQSHSHTLGMELISSLSRQINGTYAIDSPPRGYPSGTQVSIVFPLPKRLHWEIESGCEEDSN